MKKREIIPYQPRKELGRRFIYYCDFGFHQGIIRDPEKCIDRNCIYFYRFEIKK